MRPSLTFSLLLLSLVLVFEVQGIKMEKGLIMPDADNEFQKDEISLTKRIKSIINKDGEKEAILCKDDHQQHCSGNNRKLISVTHSTTSTTISKENKNSKLRVHNSNGVKSFGSDHEEASANEKYSELVNIVDQMDYSLAKRKPPVHN